MEFPEFFIQIENTEGEIKDINWNEGDIKEGSPMSLLIREGL